MFVIVDKPRFWWPVKVAVPSDKAAGTFEVQTFDVFFELRSDVDQIAWTAEVKAMTPDEFLARRHDWWLSTIHNWRGIVDRDKADIAFSKELLVELLTRPGFAAAVARAYDEATSGKAAEKN